MASEHDNAVDKVLTALRTAAPPEDMEARILQRMQHHSATQAAPSRWRNLFGGATLTGAWWRGALTGAAVATLAVCALLLFQHHSPTPHQQIAQTDAAAPGPVIPVAQVIEPARHAAEPCPPIPDTKLLRRTTSAPRLPVFRTTSVERHPVLAGPLTAQERGLLQLVRTAAPEQLATMSSEAQAKLKADDAEQFEKFFAPPVRPKPQQENE